MERKFTKNIDDASVQKLNMYMYEHSNYLQKVLVKRLMFKECLRASSVTLFYFIIFLFSLPSPPRNIYT